MFARDGLAGVLDRLVGAVLCEIHDDWAVVRRYMTMNRDEEPEQKILPAPKKHASRRAGRRLLSRRGGR